MNQSSISFYAVRSNILMRLACPAALLAVVTLHAQAPEPQNGLMNRDAAVYNKASGKVYIIDAAHSAVSVIPTSGAATSINVGSGPVSIGVNNRTGMVYVVNSGGRSVSVIDGKTDAVVATIPTGARSYAIAVDETSNKVYVSNTFSNALTVIDGATNTADSLKLGSNDALLVDADRKRVYLLGYESDAITEIDPASGASQKISTGAMHQWGILRSGRTLYVTHVQDSDVAAIDLETHEVRRLPVGTMPCAIAMHPRTGQIYVANYVDGTVTFLDKNATSATLKVVPHPQALGLDAERDLLYVASPQANAVSVIDIKTRHLVQTLTVPEHPYAIAVNPVTHTAYTANQGDTPFTPIAQR